MRALLASRVLLAARLGIFSPVRWPWEGEKWPRQRAGRLEPRGLADLRPGARTSVRPGFLPPPPLLLHLLPPPRLRSRCPLEGARSWRPRAPGGSHLGPETHCWGLARKGLTPPPPLAGVVAGLSRGAEPRIEAEGSKGPASRVWPPRR